MATTKNRITALITPVPEQAQDEARALAAEGRTGKAVRLLRKESGLGLETASAALELLTEGHSLPMDYGQALAALTRLDASLITELTVLLNDRQRDRAIKLLRKRTDIDLAGGYHLVTQLSAQLDAA